MIDLIESNNEKTGLPLVLVTVGGDDGDFEVLHNHLETVSRDPEPRFQSLIVARPDLPKMLYNVLCARIDPLPHVHIRRLGEKTDNCYELLHETGTFLVTRRRNTEDTEE
jgi:predicted glycosyltransferase